IGNTRCRRRGDLGEGRGARRPDLDADGVACNEIRLADDGRYAMRPAQELSARVDREVLIVAEADQLLEREPVAAVDVDVERRRAAGVGKQVTVEDQRLLAASPRGERARCTGREQHERGEDDVGEAPSHGETSWFGEEGRRWDRLLGVSAVDSGAVSRA